jgi:hypothetical protein
MQRNQINSMQKDTSQAVQSGLCMQHWLIECAVRRDSKEGFQNFFGSQTAAAVGKP